VSRIYWDTMLFIYWLEDNPQYARRVKEIQSRMKERRDQLLTGAFTFGEVLAGVYRRRDAQRAEEVRVLLQGAVGEILTFDLETADHYARIRAAFEVSPADAMHLAAAAHAGTDLFLTNDNRLVGKFVQGIQFIASLNDNVL
jgi:uncharacterized protein